MNESTEIALNNAELEALKKGWFFTAEVSLIRRTNMNADDAAVICNRAEAALRSTPRTR